MATRAKSDNSADLARAAERLLELALRRGADEAQVTGSYASDAKVAFERNELSLASSGEESGLMLRLHSDHRLGAAQTNSLAEEDLVATAETALAMAKFATPDEFLCFPEPLPVSSIDSRWDDALAELSSEVLSGLAQDYLASLRRDARVSIDSGSVECGRSEVLLLNSHGIRLGERETSLRWVGSGQALDGDDITSFDYETGAAFALHGARERMLENGESFGRHLISTFGARPAVSYRGLVLLTPKAVEELILGPLEYHLCGLQVFYGKSTLDDRALGTAVASPLFSLVDDPADPVLAGATAFDGEGVPAVRREFICGGRLETHFENAYSARRRGKELTGHAELSFHAASIAPGETSLASLLSPTQPLLVVHRFSGNVDAASGDFSGVAKGSHLLQGSSRRPVRETMIAGNLFELLRSLAAVTRETEVVDSSYRSPWLLADGVSVTAE